MKLDGIIARNLTRDRVHPTLNRIEEQTALMWRTRNCDLENWVSFAVNRLDPLRRGTEAGVENQNLSFNRGCNVYDWEYARGETEIVTGAVDGLIVVDSVNVLVSSENSCRVFFSRTQLCVQVHACMNILCTYLFIWTPKLPQVATSFFWKRERQVNNALCYPWLKLKFTEGQITKIREHSSRCAWKRMFHVERVEP